MLQIGALYDFKRDTNITTKASLRHSCVPEKVGVNKRRGTTGEILLSDARRRRTQPTKKIVKMKMTGRKLRNTVNFKGYVKEKRNKISGCETMSKCVVTFTFTSFSEEEVTSI